jgi:hypothetical protein
MLGVPTHQVQPLVLVNQIKRQEVVRGRERGFLTQYVHTMGRGKVNISAHFQGTDVSFRFKQMKNWDRGREECIIINESQAKCVVWSIISSVLVLKGVPEKLIS